MATKNTTQTKTIIREFPFKLEDGEKLDRGQRLAAEVQNVYDSRESAKLIAAENKKKIEAAEATVRKLREVVGTGIEWRDVECEERFYRSTGEVVTVRMDLGDVIETRPMTQKERQYEMDFDGRED